MAMSVHTSTAATNTAALTGTQHLMKSTEGLNKTMERLSTGMKINSAADDASGLVTSEYQRSHISGLKGGISNIDRAVAMVQTAESGMQEVNSLLIKLYLHYTVFAISSTCCSFTYAHACWLVPTEASGTSRNT